MNKKVLLALSCLLAAAAIPCLAMMSVGDVSPTRAKELGMEIRVKDSGPNDVWVELEFKPEGALKNFVRVTLEIRDGKKLLLGYTALEAKRSSSGSVVVSLMANRAYLEKISLMVVVGVPMDYCGHQLRMKDFVPAKLR